MKPRHPRSPESRSPPLPGAPGSSMSGGEPSSSVSPGKGNAVQGDQPPCSPSLPPWEDCAELVWTMGSWAPSHCPVLRGIPSALSPRVTPESGGVGKNDASGKEVSRCRTKTSLRPTCSLDFESRGPDEIEFCSFFFFLNEFSLCLLEDLPERRVTCYSYE